MNEDKTLMYKTALARGRFIANQKGISDPLQNETFAEIFAEEICRARRETFAIYCADGMYIIRSKRKVMAMRKLQG